MQRWGTFVDAGFNVPHTHSATLIFRDHRIYYLLRQGTQRLMIHAAFPDTQGLKGFHPFFKIDFIA